MKKLFSLLLTLLFVACSAQSPSEYQQPDGWENFGTLEQPVLRRTFDVTPASGTYDFNNATQLPWTGPFMVGLAGWVTASDVTAGALVFDINYSDPTATTRIVTFNVPTTLVLSDATSFFSTPAVWMTRETGSSLWELQTTLAGSAGTSTVHYEIMLLPDNESDVTPFSDQ